VARVFRIGQAIAVPDGTLVPPLLDASEAGPFSVAGNVAREDAVPREDRDDGRDRAP
jgi:hypothetical protein